MSKAAWSGVKLGGEVDMDVSILVTVTMKIVEKEDCQMSHNTTKMDTTTRYQKHLPKLHFRKKRECSMRKTHTHRLYYSVVYVDIVIFLQKSEMYNFSSFSKFFKVFHATHVYVTC